MESTWKGCPGRRSRTPCLTGDAKQKAIEKDARYARAYAGLADTFALMSTRSPVGQAIRLLEVAATKHLSTIIEIGVAPYYDPLRGDPRFEALLRKVHLR
jgi:hypothetical protein